MSTVRSRSFLLFRDPASVHAGRRRIRTLISGWGIQLDEETCTALDVIASELITNAVRHSVGPVLTVGVHADPGEGRALLEVYDGSRSLPKIRLAGPDEESGRGMLLVERLALAHGVQRIGLGKRVWAELALPEQTVNGSGPGPSRPGVAGRICRRLRRIRPVGVRRRPPPRSAPRCARPPARGRLVHWALTRSRRARCPRSGLPVLRGAPTMWP